MAAYTKPQQWKKENERQRGEGDKIKFEYHGNLVPRIAKKRGR